MLLFMRFASFIAIVVLHHFSSCLSGPPPVTGKTMEVIEFTTRHYLPADTVLTNPFWDFTSKIWFKDSFAIEEVRQLNIEEGSKGVTCQSYDVLFYRFNDLRKGFIYEFSQFKDSAKLLRKYSSHDSITSIGGWGFHSIRHWDYQGITERMSDTLINRTLFKRAKIYRSVKDIPYVIFCYFNCDKNGTVFNMDPDLSKSVGCPLTKIYWSTPQKKGLHMTSEVKFLADTLTAEESKVFAAWEKFAQKNPVEKK